MGAYLEHDLKLLTRNANNDQKPIESNEKNHAAEEDNLKAKETSKRKVASAFGGKNIEALMASSYASNQASIANPCDKNDDVNGNQPADSSANYHVTKSTLQSIANGESTSEK